MDSLCPALLKGSQNNWGEERQTSIALISGAATLVSTINGNPFVLEEVYQYNNSAHHYSERDVI